MRPTETDACDTDACDDATLPATDLPAGVRPLMNELSLCIPGADALIENTARGHTDEVLIDIVLGDPVLIATIRHCDALVYARTPIVGGRTIDHVETGETDEPASRLYPHHPDTLSTVEAGDSVSAFETIRDDLRLTQPAHGPRVAGGRHVARPLRPERTTARARALVVG